MDYIYEDYGEVVLYQALKKVSGDAQGMPVDVRNVDFKKRVQGIVTFMRRHLEQMKVEEDNEKVSITMQPCGSGQRLCQGGSYDPPRNLTMIEKPHAMTWGKSHFPVYCTREPMLEILSIERLGYPMTVTFSMGKW